MDKDSFAVAFSRYRFRGPRLPRPSAARLRAEMSGRYSSSDKGDIVLLDRAIASEKVCPECGGVKGLCVEHYTRRSVKWVFSLLALLLLVTASTPILVGGLGLLFVCWHVIRDLPFAGRTLATCNTCKGAWQLSSSCLIAR